jgi:hypothetical protein
MSNRHTGTGRFTSGKSTGVYRGAAKHDPSTEEIKTRLHTKPSRDVVAPHAGTASVNADGAAPHAHDTSGPNESANAATNKRLLVAGRSAPAAQPTSGEIVAAGLTGHPASSNPSPSE